MKQYHKIQSVFKRDQQTKKFIIGDYSLPEFELLKDIPWQWTEKVDGTNIRVMWDGETQVRFAGKTDNAQIPPRLLERLTELFPAEKFYGMDAICLYGEGYGAKIQKGGGNYKADGNDFVLFDVKVGDWVLKREVVSEIAVSLGIDAVPEIGRGTIGEAINLVAAGFTSMWGDFLAEGLVLRTDPELFSRNGERIITKIKTRDFT